MQDRQSNRKSLPDDPSAQGTLATVQWGLAEALGEYLAAHRTAIEDIQEEAEMERARS
jgi:hypothetical protein